MARVIEESGISTVTLNMFPEVAEHVKAPRTIQTKFVFGAPFGDSNNVKLQTNVIKECLDMIENTNTPGEIKKLPYKWKEIIAD